jgi:hypothetical protein
MMPEARVAATPQEKTLPGLAIETVVHLSAHVFNPGTLAIADPCGSVPCTIHPVLEGLYKNVYISNVICTLKYFVGAQNAPACSDSDLRKV